MKELFEKMNIPLSQETEEKLRAFSEFLLDYNEKVNLTAIKTPEEVYEKHFLDSILGAEWFPQNAKVVEIGSGGGFPSVPLKLFRDDLCFTQVESVGKKCTFLEETVARFSLKNVRVTCARAEDLGKDAKHREKYDVVTARAVANLSTLSEYCLPLVKVGGRFVCYKGTPETADEEVKNAQNALKVLGGTLKERKVFTLPCGEQRTLLLIEKTAPTPAKYPRGLGKERSKPL